MYKNNSLDGQRPDSSKIEKLILKIAKTMSHHQQRGIKWRIGGSSCLFIQGVNINPSDIEIITTKKGAEIICQIFNEFVDKPLHELEIKDLGRCYFGTLKIDGIQIEIQGELRLYEGDQLSEDLLEPIQSIWIGEVEVPISPIKIMRERYQNHGGNRAKVKIDRIDQFLRNER